jgi:hypothetical protein
MLFMTNAIVESGEGMKKIKLITIMLIILSSVLLGCVGKQVGTPTPTATPTTTETVKPTVVPTIPSPTPTPTPAPTPKLFPITYKVWIDSDRGFYIVRAVNGTTYVALPSGFDRLNFTINSGDKVRWINDDSYDFPLTLISNEGLWTGRTGLMRYNNTFFEYTFNKTGTYTFSIKEFQRIQNQTIIVNP